MAKERAVNEEETQPLTKEEAPYRGSHDLDDPRDSISSASTTSLVLESLSGNASKKPRQPQPYADTNGRRSSRGEFDIEDGPYYGIKSADRKLRRWIWILGAVCLASWVFAAFAYIHQGTYKHSSTKPHDPLATASRGSGKKVTLDQVLGGYWRASQHDISWIAGPNGEDGLLLERGGTMGKGYLYVDDVRRRDDKELSPDGRVLMKNAGFYVNNRWVGPAKVWPSADFKKVLVMSDQESNWRHSFFGKYWIFDVETQQGEALDPADPEGQIQLAQWSPKSNAVVFTRDNNMFLRRLDTKTVTKITTDGGSELFYGVPDWVYEEEILGANSATWWSQDGKFIAFLRTDESAVPTYPVEYFIRRPSGTQPKAGEENYPEVRNIKYPKAGAPNPTVSLQFFDIGKNQIFDVAIDGDFEDLDRLITEVVWGQSNEVIIRETNRESDLLKIVLINVEKRSGSIVRTDDVNALDGGWFEVAHETTFVPADPANGRPQDGYVEPVIADGYDHLGYFTPMNASKPLLLTRGKWEVVDAPSAIDLKNNLVYFTSTKESSIQRHPYRVKLDGTGLEALTDVGKEGYYDSKFSTGAGYALLTYQGPDIPWQKVISTPSNSETYTSTIEENPGLAELARSHELPLQVYSTINIDGYDLNVLERRPPHFNPKKKYPVLFYMYQGPGSQSVNKKFAVDFQAYVASNLGYIVVTVDGRGTGFIGRKARCIVRGNIGHWEAHDQIEAAKMWAAKKYVDADRMAIWGWSYGGFMTLKTLEQDAGQTFSYGMAVAPVTDWRYYDSVYTERYMHTPQHNPSGYDNATITNTTAMSQNVRFLMMHGTGDDNVHMQNTLALLDRLDLAGVENYDVHVFPDSDHSIYFHNANRIVYDKLSAWLVNAFNGEWSRTENPVPLSQIEGRLKER
ncbi:putative dipeptidyl-aminopeptidase B [Saccharata proteae CBS 121410]|uniref:dipeptidyl-peptidase IV n=1 Tax=Saccharata proteae CBS 121410 TaxID=1314787 RepID=A0A9P4HZ38_9PEZI|nr:putative dipeptidyl-aminopeptidase B [Saccharata proteae CBS 121410]